MKIIFLTLALAWTASAQIITPATESFVTNGGALGAPSSGDFSSGAFTWPTFNQNTTGSAATLTTARTINGVSFNGSANIGQNLQTSATPTFAGANVTSAGANAVATFSGSTSAYVTGSEFSGVNRWVLRPTTSFAPVFSIGQSGDVTNGSLFELFGRGNAVISNQEVFRIIMNNAFGASGTNDVVIDTVPSGSGSARPIRFKPNNTQSLYLGTTGGVNVGGTIDPGLNNLSVAGTHAVTGSSNLTGDVTTGAKIIAGAQVRLKGYTVATLPGSPTQGDTAFVTDALTPTYLAVAVGGGAVIAPVIYNGTNWVAH